MRRPAAAPTASLLETQWRSNGHCKNKWLPTGSLTVSVSKTTPGFATHLRSKSNAHAIHTRQNFVDSFLVIYPEIGPRTCSLRTQLWILAGSPLGAQGCAESPAHLAGTGPRNRRPALPAHSPRARRRLRSCPAAAAACRGLLPLLRSAASWQTPAATLPHQALLLEKPCNEHPSQSVLKLGAKQKTP